MIEGRNALTSPLKPCRKRKLGADMICGVEMVRDGDVSKHASFTNMMSPYQYVQEVFVDNGYHVAECSVELSELFAKPSEAQIAAYKVGTVKAARLAKTSEIRTLHAAGVSFDCCNRFGESLVSMVCRKGNADVIQFLVKEANVSLLIRDDFGRTVLHDAFWTTEPEFELINFLLQEVPDLLFVKDVRGHTPLDYVRKEHWEAWIAFFQDRKNLLRPKLLNDKL
jgi:Ankyrin repeats (3 copies)